MGDTEQKTTVGEGSDLPPPPAYQHKESVENGAAPPLPKSLPLPTYAQSERYTKEGVVPPSGSTASSDTEDISEAPLRARMWSKQNGTCSEFILFFIVCALFSVFGFIFSFCLASSTAAQSGAIAGLGAAFISKPLLYEVYYSGYEQQWSKDWCSQHTDVSDQNNCIHLTTTTMRTLFFILGFFGLVLLYRGVASFFASRGPTNN